ncbi:formyltransferase family protein [Aurantimonas sp. C2-6-R+9]|uniref:formyltransferase family protein n=1 Tax=unclassified Aurantimonas TaxID=2638230 RepID=UPI002E190F2F|nr:MULTISPECIES: formyltransferase family protein [unclassified Aurantimonas]MEC5290628.1 formyltransferase family protein [Aurantimonas sp. C2-3-R2]MEC5380658.1 formyltransferase family protein [Aurantimonas sp. C2-6-R+9]MEC5411704.1 formyltransferase family protein [Aurantimonas sp. C2-4-R8]
MNAVRRQRIAILISGRGTNMSALAAASMDPTYPGQIVGVIANHADAPGLETAERSGIMAGAVDQANFASRLVML